MKSLRTSFPLQDENTWRIVSSQLRRLLREGIHSTQPVVIVLAHASSHAEIRCFLRAITTMFMAMSNSANTTAHVHLPSVVHDTSTVELKLTLDGLIWNHLLKTRCLVLHDINVLAGETAMLLHSYCDHQHAPFKNILLLLTCNLDKKFHDDARIARQQIFQVNSMYLIFTGVLT